MGGKDLGKCPPLLIGVRAELDVGQAITEGNGNAVAFKGLHVRGDTSDGGGLIKDLPTKVFHLAGAHNGATIAHVSSTTEKEDAWLKVGVGDTSSNGEAQVVDCVVCNAVEVDGAREERVDVSVSASNGTVGTTIDQSKVFSSSERVNQVLADGVNADGV